MNSSELKVIKKDGTKEEFNVQKVVVAVNKSAERAMITFTPEELDFICRFVTDKAENLGIPEIPIPQMHNLVEGALEQVNPAVAKSYRDYRNYKQDFVQMLDEVYKKSQSIMYIGDKENSNTDSALVSTKRSLIFNELNKSLYQKFFMTVEELQACRDLSGCLLRMGKPEEAFAALAAALRYGPPRAELCCDLGQFFFHKGDYPTAAFWYETALSRPRPDQTGAFVSPDCYGFLPCIQLCVCYYRMGEEELAREYNRRAGNCKPDNEAFLYNERFFRGEL